jgi:hypothetical protein
LRADRKSGGHPRRDNGCYLPPLRIPNQTVRMNTSGPVRRAGRGNPAWPGDAPGRAILRAGARSARAVDDLWAGVADPRQVALAAGAA